MKLLLILLGVYVYFVVGNLVNTYYNKKVDYKYKGQFDEFLGVISFPMLIAILIVLKLSEIRLPKFNIPFTPKKVADLICSIRIVKTPEKVDEYHPTCFGNYRWSDYGCARCDFNKSCEQEKK